MTESPDTKSSLSPNELVEGKYRIVSPLAEGGIGAIYHAIQEPLGRNVALKVLKTTESSEQREVSFKRFFREAALCSRLNHSNTVMIFDYGKLTNMDGFFLVMEYLDGQSLRELLNSHGRLSSSLAIHIAIQIASSLADAHRAGVVHRDLKPPNIMIVKRSEDDHFVKVVDFGLVKDVRDTDEDVTGKTTLMGSPGYIAPERYLYHNADSPSVDIYSLGVILYEMLVGRPPFLREAGANLNQLLMQQVHEAPPPMRSIQPTLQLPHGLESIVMRCLAKEPSDRFESMEALIAQLRTCLQPTPIPSFHDSRREEETGEIRNIPEPRQETAAIAARHRPSTMRVTNLSNDLSAESIHLLCESLQAHLNVPIRASDATVLTGLPIETAREALVSLAIRNNARTTTIDDDLAYIFKRVTPSGRRMLPPAVRRAGRYFGDLVTGQFGYLLGAMVLIGPTFVGARMVELGLQTHGGTMMEDLFYLTAGGTLALACATLLLKLAVRSISVVLPPLVIAGIAMGWERWTAEDLYWIPLAVLVAIGLQLEVLWNYRKVRPKDPIALFLWGKTFTSPVRDHKRVIELILEQQGTVTTADLIRTFGWTEDHASEQLSNVIAEFGGDVAVDQDGDIFVYFEELSRTKQVADRPVPSYEREDKPPSPFEGLDLRWVSAATVACWLAVVASPMNPAYIRFVGDLDFTLSGTPFIVRTIFAGFCIFPMLLYLGRIVFNAIERDDFKKRREFLDALAYADKHAEGSHVGHDKFTNAQLAELGAEIDEDRSVENAIWVSFPLLSTKSAPENITEYFLDLSSKDQEDDETEARTEAQQAHAEVSYR